MRTLSRPRIGRRWSHAAVFALSALFCLAVVSADAVVPGTDPTAFARNANLARGLSESSRPFGPDRLNLFNGNLTLALPIGDGYPVSSHFSYELVLAYNSLAWDFEEATAGAGAAVAAQPAAASNAGFGWDLSLGRLLAPGAPGNPDPTWAYVGPHGRRHLFYGSLNDGAVVEPGALYSRDGSYLRLDSEDASTRVLRHPDGRYRRFVETNGEWRVDRIGDHRGAQVDASWSPDGLTWTLTDLHGRQQVVVFAADPNGVYDRLVDEVRLTAFGGATAVYEFHYVTATVERPAVDDDPATPATLALSLLDRVDRPDGTSHQLGYHSGVTLDSGLLASLRLPTLGEVRWQYGVRELPWISCTADAERHLVDVVGVVARSTHDESGAVLGTWSVAAAFDVPRPKSSTCDQPREMAVTVTTPLGHLSRQYFSVFVSGAPGAEGWRVEEYGLPFTRRAQDASGLFLSREVLDGPTLVRAERVAFEEDAYSGCGACFERNHRVAAHRVVHLDDAGHWTETQLQGFDGYGSYTTEIESSSFPGELTTTRVATLQSDLGGWLLGKETAETKSRGSESETSRFCLDAQGDRVRVRRLAGGTEGAHDLVTVFVRDALGNRVEKAHHGGDVVSLPTTPDLCAVSLPDPVYRQLTSWDHGGVESIRWVTAKGATVLSVADQDLDPSTALPSTRRDVSGLATSFEYDLASRLVRSVEPNGTEMEASYEAAAAASPAAEVRVWSDAGGTVLTEQRTTFDDFGRLASETVPNAAGADATESWQRDAEGNVVAWTDPLGKTTLYLELDPFGRVRRERPPTGAADDRTYAYQGERVVLETWRGGLYFTTSSAALVQGAKWARRTFDSSGRLVEAAAHGGDVSRMAYDLAGRLVRNSHASPVDPEYVLFERLYDGRGFLVEQTDGDGQTTLFAGYDPLGHLTTQTTMHGTLLNEFDGAGRLIRVSDGGGQLLKEFEYAGGNGTGDYRKGKLRKAIRHNHEMVDVDGALVVTETFFYEEPGGRPSRSRITLKDDAGTHQTFWSATTWDALGQAESFEYPECNGSWRLDCTAKTRVVETAYHAANRRLLKKVSTTYNGGPAGDLAANVTYFDDQRLKQITFGGGPLTYQVFTAHPQLPGRYERESICTQAACQHFDPLVYDGDGRQVRQVLGPILPDDRRSLPTGPPAPSANRPTRAELVAAVDGGTPPACPVTSHDALGKLTHVDRCTGGAEPRHLFYAYDAQDRRLWTVGSNDGVNHTTWESRFELRDHSGRTVRRYERLSNTLTQVEDYVYAGPTLVGYVRGWSSQVGEGDRFYVHTDLAGRPHMKHRVENGQVVEWSAW